MRVGHTAPSPGPVQTAPLAPDDAVAQVPLTALRGDALLGRLKGLAPKDAVHFIQTSNLLDHLRQNLPRPCLSPGVLYDSMAGSPAFAVVSTRTWKSANNKSNQSRVVMVTFNGSKKFESKRLLGCVATPKANKQGVCMGCFAEVGVLPLCFKFLILCASSPIEQISLANTGAFKTHLENSCTAPNKSAILAEVVGMKSHHGLFGSTGIKFEKALVGHIAFTNMIVDDMHPLNMGETQAFRK